MQRSRPIRTGAEYGRSSKEVDPASTFVPIAFLMPPSVNAIWRVNRRTGKPYISERYATWKRDAENRFLINKRNWQPVKGNFRAHVTLDASRRRGDADNRMKALFDALQRFGLIEDDKLCDGLTVVWGHAPEGCRVRLRESNQQKRAA